MNRSLLLGCVVIALCPTAWGQNDSQTNKDIAGIRSRLISSSPAWVAQEVSFFVELMSAANFTGTPRFELPEIPGVILMKVEGSPVLSSEQIDDVLWSIQRHEFRVYAHREGLITIPSFAVRFSVAPAYDAPPEPQRMLTDAISFDSRMPPGAPDVPLLVSTTQLKVTETWNPPLGPERNLSLQVGDAVNRRISMEATDVPGMALPAIGLSARQVKENGKELSVLAAYPKSARVSDATSRGDLTGQRTDMVSYVCERVGTTSIPAVVITWWDIDSQELHQINLPVVTIEVRPNEAAVDAEAETNAQAGQPNQNRTWRLSLLVLTFVLACLSGLSRKRLAKWYDQYRRHQAESERAANERIRQACEANDAPATLNALMAWIDRTTASPRVTTLESFTRQLSDAKLSAEVDQLQRAVVRRDKNWTGKQLWTELNRARRHRTAQQDAKRSRRTTLPSLNP